MEFSRPDWHPSYDSGQQPMSMMTINANPTRKEGDMLTIRILESSERKMQLIKELLSTEEYLSVANKLDLKNYADIEQVYSIDSYQQSLRDTWLETPKLEQVEDAHDSNLRSFSSAVERNWPTATCTDLDENIARKRHAVDFFFKQPDDDLSSNQSNTNLAIELRSGYYLTSSTGSTPTNDGRPILRDNDFSLMDRLIGLLGFLGISIDCSQQNLGDAIKKQQGVDTEYYYKQLNCEPYSRKRNLATMEDRLKCDGQDRILGIINRFRKDKEVGGSSSSNLVDLAKVHTNQLCPSGELLNPQLEKRHSPLIQSVGQSKTIHLMPAMPYIDAVDKFDLLDYHPNVKCLMKLLKKRREAKTQDTLGGRTLDSHWIQLDLLDLKFTGHPLMLPDESASKLIEPVDRCSLNELARRKQICSWVQSIRVFLFIGDDYYHKVSAKLRENYLFASDINTKLIIPLANQVRSGPIKMKVDIYTPRTKFLPIGYRLVASGTSNNILATVNDSQTISIEFEDDDIKAELSFRTTNCSNEKRKNQRRIIGEVEKVVEYLCAQTFATKNPYEETSAKISRLLNKVDLNFLSQMLYGKLKTSDFTLDPLADLFQANDREINLEGRKLLLGPIKASQVSANSWASNRQALIVWRWLNQSNQLVYLSERENVKYYGARMDDAEIGGPLSDTLSSNNPEKPGYSTIEQSRHLAAEYLKHYETELREVMRFNAEKSVGPTNRCRELLLEPKLKVNLSGAWRKTLSLVPKRTAHRPLLPRRQPEKVANRFGTNDAYGLSVLSLSIADRPITDLERGAVADLGETSNGSFAALEIASHWHQIAAQQRTRLQLVITVQQAANVPMRVVQLPALAGIRSASPFNQSPSPVNNFMPSIQQQQQHLQAPICYVELVFQRRHQTSSLAQGKHPAWNETLFFPVELGDNRQANQSQLADEFLQLNLYDYHCYMLQDMQQQLSDLSTLPMVSGTASNYDELSMSPLPSNQSLAGPIIQASRQHIERHLLGSLRIPLSSLMSSGKIEGSFALKQPLFLDNYQFEPIDPSFDGRATNSPLSRLEAGRFNARLHETLMSLFITLDPPMSIPLHLYLPTGVAFESDQVFQYVRLWEQVVSQQHYRRNMINKRTNLSTASLGTLRKPNRLQQSRHVRALVLQREAKYCLINRLLGPIKPPGELLGQSKDLADQMETLARFVSLISPLKYGLLSMRLLAASLWFDSRQLINRNLGGHEEKATLLCNYFLYLGKCCAILLGDSVPEGRCVWVLVWQEKSRFIENQLQLQATDLLESIGLGSVRAPQVNPGSQRPFVDKENFLARLPSIITADSVSLWDPCSGKSYTLSDALPLISVGCIVTVENVYANIQSIDQPARTNFDIRSKQCWFSLFNPVDSNTHDQQDAAALSRVLGNSTNSMKRDLVGTKQVNWRRQMNMLEALRKSFGRPQFEPLVSADQELNYQKLSEEQCHELQETIMRNVKSHLIQWRSDRPTYFNRTLSRLLADRLVQFEGNMTGSGGSSSRVNQSDGQWKTELVELIREEVLMAHLSTSGLQTRQVISCPVNLPFTTMKSILDTVFASGVHNADLVVGDPDLQRSITSSQFLVACYVHPYPARVASIWLYAAAIVPSTVRTNHNTTRLLQPR